MLDLSIVWLLKFQTEKESPLSKPVRIVTSTFQILFVTSYRFKERIFLLYVLSGLLSDSLWNLIGLTSQCVLTFALSETLREFLSPVDLSWIKRLPEFLITQFDTACFDTRAVASAATWCVLCFALFLPGCAPARNSWPSEPIRVL